MMRYLIGFLVGLVFSAAVATAGIWLNNVNISGGDVTCGTEVNGVSACKSTFGIAVGYSTFGGL